jgi:hypothetical protein
VQRQSACVLRLTWCAVRVLEEQKCHGINNRRLCLIAKFQTLNERTPLSANTIKVVLPLRKIVAHSVKFRHGIAAFICRFLRSADELVTR